MVIAEMAKCGVKCSPQTVKKYTGLEVKSRKTTSKVEENIPSVNLNQVEQSNLTSNKVVNEIENSGSILGSGNFIDNSNPQLLFKK